MFEEYFKSNQKTVRKLSKSDMLQTPGVIATKAFYVKSGLLRSYTIDDNGKIHIFMFAPEGWIISDIESHTLSKPTEFYIDALEDSEIVEFSNIDPETFKKANERNPEIIDKLFRRIAVLQRRVILLMSAPAKVRYEHFIETYPQLANRVPLKMIASYLGITPEALSNIRNKLKNQPQ